MVAEDANKVKHLLELPKASTHLSLWRGELAEEGSFDHAIQGCSGVFHVATPTDFFPDRDPEVLPCSSYGDSASLVIIRVECAVRFWTGTEPM